MKIVYVQKVDVSAIYFIAFLGAPFMFLGFASEPLWMPSYVDGHRDTVKQELERGKYYDDKGGWIGWTNRKEADRRARESYEDVVRTSSNRLLTWQAHDNLGQMAYDESDFKQSITHWKNAQSLSDSSWQQTSLKEKIGWANCRISGGTALKCMGLE